MFDDNLLRRAIIIDKRQPHNLSRRPRPPQCMMILRIQPPALSFWCFDSKGNTHDKSPFSCKENCVSLYMTLFLCKGNGVLLCMTAVSCIENGVLLYMISAIFKFCMVYEQIRKFSVDVIVRLPHLDLFKQSKVNNSLQISSRLTWDSDDLILKTTLTINLHSHVKKNAFYYTWHSSYVKRMAFYFAWLSKCV